MDFFQQKTNWTQIFIGFLMLLMGSLVYLIDRPPEQVYIVYENKLPISLHDTLPNLFGIIGNTLPAFSHVFAFILITSGITSSGKKGCIIISICWFLIDILFEVSQKFGSTVASLLPSWFESIPFLNSIPAYFIYGTFDWFDITAIAAGSICAYFVLIRTMKGKGAHDIVMNPSS